MLSFIRKHALPLAGILAGAAAGFIYWRLAGCSSGGCAITSSPVNSSLYGALMGGLLFSIFDSKKTKKDS